MALAVGILIVEVKLALDMGALASGASVFAWAIGGQSLPISTLGAVFAIIACAKFLVANQIAQVRSAGSRSFAALAICTWVFFAVGMVLVELSYASAISAQRRIDVSHINALAVHRRSEIDEDLRRLNREIGGIGFTVNSTAEIDSEINVKRQHPRWVSQKDCETISGAQGRKLCFEVSQLILRRQSAVERDAKRIKLEHVKAKLLRERDSLPKPVVDPDAMLAVLGALGMSASSASLVWAGIASLLLQLAELSALGIGHRASSNNTVRPNKCPVMTTAKGYESESIIQGYTRPSVGCVAFARAQSSKRSASAPANPLKRPYWLRRPKVPSTSGVATTVSVDSRREPRPGSASPKTQNRLVGGGSCATARMDTQQLMLDWVAGFVRSNGRIPMIPEMMRVFPNISKSTAQRYRKRIASFVVAPRTSHE